MLTDNMERIKTYPNTGDFNPFLTIFYDFLFIACIFIYTSLLPFYIYANKVNHERDKEIPIYPITKHFYQMVIVYYLIFVLTCISIFFHYYSSNRLGLTSYVFSSLFISLNIITQVFHVLLFVLAVERFFIYFVPSSRKLFKSSQYKIKYLYFLIMTKEVSCLLYSCWNYVPVKKRKYIYVAENAQRSQPHKYIFLQTMVVLSFKSIQVLVFLMTSHNGISLTSLFIYAIILSDYITTPLIVQMSYLSCNKRNMNVLLSNISARKLFNVLFSLRTGATVFPRSSTIYSTHMI